MDQYSERFSDLSRGDNPKSDRVTRRPPGRIIEIMENTAVRGYRMECGRRLRRARVAIGFRVRRRFAQATDTDEDNLEKWEHGKAMVPPSFIRKIKQVWGVTYDYIYDGDLRGLPHELALKLIEPTKAGAD